MEKNSDPVGTLCSTESGHALAEQQSGRGPSDSSCSQLRRRRPGPWSFVTCVKGSKNSASVKPITPQRAATVSTVTPVTPRSTRLTNTG